MSFQEMMDQFNRDWTEAEVAKAILRGIPEDLARAFDDGMSRTEAGTFAFVSHGDARTILAEFSEQEIREFLALVVNPPKTALPKYWEHPDFRNTPHWFGDAPKFFTTGGQYWGIGTPGISVTWWTRSAGGNNGIEVAHVLFHIDGTASLAQAGAWGQAEEIGPGNRPLTEGLLRDLGIPLVWERRASTPEDWKREERSRFIYGHAPTPERAVEIQQKLEEKHWIVAEKK